MNAKHDSDTILNERFARKARSRAGERISNRSGTRIVTEHLLKRKQSDLGFTMQIVIDHDDDD